MVEHQRGRRAPALARRLLAASPVNVSAGATPLASLDYGDAGPRVAFLHGLFGQGRNWTGVGKALADAARVVLVDLPDHGRSPWSAEFSYLAMARRVGDSLAARAPAETWTLVGHSMGGKVAMLVALTRPELVQRLCVIDVSPVPGSAVGSFGHYVSALRGLELGRLADRGGADRALTPMIADAAVRVFLLQNLRRDATTTVGWRWQMNLDLLGDALSQIGGWPAVAGSYDGPVLWLAGARSDYVRDEFVPGHAGLVPAGSAGPGAGGRPLGTRRPAGDRRDEPGAVSCICPEVSG